MTKSPSVHGITGPMVEKQQELLRDLHDLLTLFGPMWDTEDIDTRLAGTIAAFTKPNDMPGADDRRLTTTI